MGTTSGITIDAPSGAVEPEAAERVLTPGALDFLAELHERFNPVRLDLLARRAQRQAALDNGALPGFLPETRPIRESSWQVAAPPEGLVDRRVEITGPVDRKMIINALNSGAKAFMADFEDANSPTWANCIHGQSNLAEAVRGSISLASDAKTYELKPDPAQLLVRPRGWHLPERHAVAGAAPMSASLFDFGLFVFHNGAELARNGKGPWFYLPKLESHLEARLWNDVFTFSEARLDLPAGCIRATVLIETVLAAFEMDEILYELRDHSAGLNAGRWDYIFSVIKKFRNRPDVVLPDRTAVTMTAPFMRAYTELLVKTCHRRGAHAMGGMAAFIPNRRDPEVTETALAKVREDKRREAHDGFDGTWVAHPDLVDVSLAEFDAVLEGAPNQIRRRRDDVDVSAAQLLNFVRGPITAEGLRTNVAVGIEYLESWLRGTGAAALYNLMEDTATAEISRSQIWQWIRRGASLSDGRRVTRELVTQIADEHMARVGSGSLYAQARELFERVALSDEFGEFLTLPAYEQLG